MFHGQDDSGHNVMLPDRMKNNAKADTVKLLIDNGADVTAQDETGSTPLHLASSFGGAETARVLIKHGADVTARDGNRRTPLHLASSRVSTETVRRLFIQHSLMSTDRTRASERISIRQNPTTRLIQCGYCYSTGQM